MPTFEYSCPDCELISVGNFKYAERPMVIKCDKCGEEKASYVLSAPYGTRASYLDGTKRFQDAKEASKLNKEMASTKNKAEIKKEIGRLGFNYDKKGI